MHQTFAALADPLRLQIVERIATNEQTVGELVLALGRSQPNISKALRVLRDADLVTVRRVGRLRFYHLRSDRFDAVARWALAATRRDATTEEGRS